MHPDVYLAVRTLSEQPDVVDYLTSLGYVNRPYTKGQLRSESCPVAQYLQNVTGMAGLSVARNFVGVDDESLLGQLPEKINEAIDHFDRLTYGDAPW